MIYQPDKVFHFVGGRLENVNCIKYSIKVKFKWI